jgi:broad specificity phosphatase PhoE
MNKTVYFIRHGEAAYNLLDRVNAHPHVANDLTVTGRDQAACCARLVAGIGIEVVFCWLCSQTVLVARVVSHR